MFRLSSKIKLGDYILAGVVEIEIESSWETLTDTAKITLPSQFYHNGKFVNLAEERLLKKGDKVSISLGYDDDLVSEFEGYIVEIKAASPVVIECQDAAWLLKKKPQNVSFAQVKFKELVQAICPPEISNKVADVSLGQFRVSNATPAQVLDEIKKSYGLLAYMRGTTLYAGLSYTEQAKTHIFKFGVNVIEENSELFYQKEDDVRLKIKAVSIQPNNTKIETEFGDADGELRTLTFYNLDKDSLDKIAKSEAEKLIYNGYTGHFETFGIPSVVHGDIVHIKDEKYNRSGFYFIKKVVKVFGGGGYRQKIYIDREV